MVFSNRSEANLESDPAVTGALIASQLLLKDANPSEMGSMKLQATGWSGHKPNSFDIDTNGDSLLEASATVNRTIAGNLSSIEVDQFRNGRVDTRITADRDRWGNITLMHIDINNDGKADAVAHPIRTKGSSQVDGIIGLRIDKGNDGITDMNISFQRENRKWVREITKDFQDTGVDSFIYLNDITAIDVDTNGDTRTDLSFTVARDGRGNINRIYGEK